MFGQFNPESFEKKEAANLPQMELDLNSSRKDLAEEFFSGHLQGARTLTGGEYIKFFQLGTEAGFTDQEFKAYLEERGIKVRSALPPAEDSPAISYHTPDNGKY